MTGVYEVIEFPEPPNGRPYVFINMVSTIDGKILTGDRDEPVMDLGSKLDHATMRQIQAAADGIMIGAGTLRATPNLWYSEGKYRFVVSGSGNVDPFVRFFTDDPSRAFVATSIESAAKVPEEAQAICVGQDELDFEELLGIMRNEMDISYLLIEGGSHLNSDLFRLNLVDEIFLTFAPKIKLGEEVPTIADGTPLARADVQNYELLSVKPVANELFLRYRRK